MTFKADERIRETSVTQGAGTYTLGGSPTGFQAVSVIGANNYGPFFVTDGTNWEAIIGQYLSAPDRLTRDAVLASSNAGAAVNWGVGTRTIRCGWPAWLNLPRALSKATGGGAGTTVLTQNEQRRASIEFTGVLTGNRIIEVDATPWPWIVYNNTTGAFTLTMRVTGQVGVVVPQGRRMVLYCDGVDVNYANTSVGPSGSEFASTTALVFHQTSAPVGWTKDTTHNDKGLRVVSGTVGSGGATGFTSVFGSGKVTGSDTPSITKTAAHTHTIAAGPTSGASGGADTYRTDGAATTGSTGGGTAHNHTLSLDLLYADVIFATKD